MSDFDDLRDGGRRLAVPLAEYLDHNGIEDAVLVPAIPNGVPVVLGLLESMDLAVVPLPVERTESGVRIEPVPELAGRIAVVVDDGVETGTVARAAAVALRASNVAGAVLAAPVCPREAMADLNLRYDAVVAVATPLVRRDLTWHYADFDTIDESEARRLLADS
jgi:putative phosphoribosyl transferase